MLCESNESAGAAGRWGVALAVFAMSAVLCFVSFAPLRPINAALSTCFVLAALAALDKDALARMNDSIGCCAIKETA